jgi:hypothetical protein
MIRGTQSKRQVSKDANNHGKGVKVSKGQFGRVRHTKGPVDIETCMHQVMIIQMMNRSV